MEIQNSHQEQYQPVQTNDHSAAPTPSCWRNLNWKMIGGIVLGSALLLNIVLMSVLVTQLSHAQKTADQFSNQINTMYTPMKSVFDTFDRFLHGSVPDLLNDLITIDFYHFGGNFSALASDVVSSFDYGDPDMLRVSQYASFVQSVSAKFQNLQPNYAPPPTPSDDLGILNVMGYLIDWANQQTNPVSWQKLGKQCTALIDSLVNQDWSGTYYWNHKTESAQWNANSAKSSAQTVRQYCEYIASINPTTFFKNFKSTRHGSSSSSGSSSSRIPPKSQPGQAHHGSQARPPRQTNQTRAAHPAKQIKHAFPI